MRSVNANQIGNCLKKEFNNLIDRSLKNKSLQNGGKAMQQKQRKQAEVYATRLTQAFNLDDGIVESVKKGELYCSVVMLGQQKAYLEPIDRNQSQFGVPVRVLERNEGVLVYHCILSGPILTMLYVPNDCHQWDDVGPVVGSDEVHIYEADLNNMRWNDRVVTLGSYDHVLIRLT